MSESQRVGGNAVSACLPGPLQGCVLTDCWQWRSQKWWLGRQVLRHRNVSVLVSSPQHWRPLISAYIWAGCLWVSSLHLFLAGVLCIKWRLELYEFAHFTLQLCPRQWKQGGIYDLLNSWHSSEFLAHMPLVMANHMAEHKGHCDN